MALSKLKGLLTPFVMAFAFLLAFTATAHAAAAVEPSGGSLLDLLQPVLDAFQHGSYLYAGSLALVVAVALTRRYIEPKYVWLSSDAGAGVLTLLGAFGASMVATFAGGVVFEWSLVWHSLEIAFGAAGGYTVVKHVIIAPYVKHLAESGPSWLHSPMKLILWIFQEDGTAPTPSELAEAAVAVANAPQNDVVVSVTTPAGTAVASSPAVAPPAPISVVATDVLGEPVAPAVGRTPTPITSK